MYIFIMFWPVNSLTYPSMFISLLINLVIIRPSILTIPYQTFQKGFLFNLLIILLLKITTNPLIKFSQHKRHKIFRENHYPKSYHNKIPNNNTITMLWKLFLHYCIPIFIEHNDSSCYYRFENPMVTCLVMFCCVTLVR